VKVIYYKEAKRVIYMCYFHHPDFKVLVIKAALEVLKTSTYGLQDSC